MAKCRTMLHKAIKSIGSPEILVIGLGFALLVPILRQPGGWLALVGFVLAIPLLFLWFVYMTSDRKDGGSK